MLQAALRAAAVQLLADYKDEAEIKLQIYPGRPRSIFPPTAFVDRISESIAYPGMTLVQRTPEAEVMVLHGLFDHGDTVAQRDAFVDGFLAWVVPRFHAAGANTLTALVGVDDDPSYVPEWLQPSEQKTYYGTRLTLRGYAEDT